ncbi:MAG: hypothetical protein IPK55_13840 [Streptococcus sp.]|nr:hypothetical protein [Streptococcus sp.]
MLILEKFAGIVHNNTLSKSVSFYHVPGYELILKTILSEMTERDVKDYPDALIKAITKCYAIHESFNVSHIDFQENKCA